MATTTKRSKPSKDVLAVLRIVDTKLFTHEDRWIAWNDAPGGEFAHVQQLLCKARGLVPLKVGVKK